jgi:hypothetical protein
MTLEAGVSQDRHAIVKLDEGLVDLPVAMSDPAPAINDSVAPLRTEPRHGYAMFSSRTWSTILPP